MTQRMWKWAGGLGGLGLVVLAFAIHARATWQPSPSSSPDASITLNQLVGFILAAGLLVMASLIGITGFRRHRENRRPGRWTGFADDGTIDIDTTGIQEHQGR